MEASFFRSVGGEKIGRFWELGVGGERGKTSMPLDV